MTSRSRWQWGRFPHTHTCTCAHAPGRVGGTAVSISAGSGHWRWEPSPSCCVFSSIYSRDKYSSIACSLQRCRRCCRVRVWNEQTPESVLSGSFPSGRKRRQETGIGSDQQGDLDEVVLSPLSFSGIPGRGSTIWLWHGPRGTLCPHISQTPAP